MKSWLAVLASVFLGVATVAAPVGAAGAESAVLTGPGIDAPVDLYALEPALPAITGAWFTAGAEDVTPLMFQAPTTSLGDRFVLTWVLRGPPELPPEQRSVVQYVYPFAEGGPLVETPRRQDLLQGTLWEGSFGWYAGGDQLGELLTVAGVEPNDHGRPVALTIAGGFVAVVLAVVLTATVVRRRPTRTTA